MTLLRLEGVGFTYPGSSRPALEGIGLSLEAGEWLGILGAARAGKSTLCMIPNGVIPRFHPGTLTGRVLLRGQDRTSLPVHQAAATVGLVLEDFEAQIFHGRVDEEVAFGPENLGTPREEISQRVALALKTLGLEGLEDRDPQRLSGGQKQRLILASVLSTRPALWALDQPWSDLDPLSRERITRSLQARGGAGLVAAADLEQLPGVDRLLLLSEGRPLALDSRERVLRDEALLQAAGLPLPPLAELFATLGRPERPLEVEEALKAWTPPPSPTPDLRLADLDEQRRARLGETILTIEEVSFGYGPGDDQLRSVSLALRRGEVVALLGHNGSGKSTLARHLPGLLRPRRGRILLHGRDIRALPTSRLGLEVGLLFQNPDHQIFADTVQEEVAFGPVNMGLSPAEAGRRVEEALEAVGLAGRERDDPFSMSRGERQRLALASSLATRAELLVLDEPTTGLDPLSSRALMDRMEDLSRRGHTILFTTHSMELAARHAHRILLMESGHLLADGSAREILHQPDLLARAGLSQPPVVEWAGRAGLRAVHAQEAALCLG